MTGVGDVGRLTIAAATLTIGLLGGCGGTGEDAGGATGEPWQTR